MRDAEIPTLDAGSLHTTLRPEPEFLTCRSSSSTEAAAAGISHARLPQMNPDRLPDLPFAALNSHIFSAVPEQLALRILFSRVTVLQRPPVVLTSSVR